MNTVVTCAVHTETTINIPDAYNADGYDFSGTKKFDQQTGYRTRSLLTVPMKNHQGVIIGVLQLINSKDYETGETNEFTSDERHVTESLASQAAVALTNNRLIEEQKKLFESFIELLAGAIDAKSPYTGGHCRRLPELTLMIAEACNEEVEGLLGDFHLSDKDFYELKIAGWLHDCGKVTTPEYVVDKATKLETIYDRINTVDTRFEVLKRDAKIEMLEQKLSRLNGSSKSDFSELEKNYEEKIEKMDDDRDFIRSSNIGGEFMDDDLQQRVKDIAEYRWINPGRRRCKITRS